MTAQAHKRAIIQQGQAYRWEVAERESAVAEKERRLDSMIDELVRARVDSDPVHGYRILIDVSDDVRIAVRHGTLNSADFYQRVAQRIMRGLAGFDRDHRADLREVALGRPEIRL